MFPLKANDPYIKATGERSTLGSELGGGGSDTPELPEYSIADAGKVLEVDNDGDLEWKMIGGMKLYYKTFTQTTDKKEISSGLTRWKVQNISVDGYTPLFATCSDNLTGYWTMPTGIGYEYSGGTPSYVPALGILTSYAGTTSTFASPITVYYAKNEDIQSLV